MEITQEMKETESAASDGVPNPNYIAKCNDQI